MTGAIHVKIIVLILFCFSYGNAADLRFTSNERTIINSVIKQFQRECGHISNLDESKLKEIQNFYQIKREAMSDDVKNCYVEYLSQLVGTHNIYGQTCESITSQTQFGADKDLARIFINVRKYESGIKSYHEKLNECLLRKGASPKDTVAFSDYEKNGRTLSKEIREISIEMPFRENSVNYR